MTFKEQINFAVDGTLPIPEPEPLPPLDLNCKNALNPLPPTLVGNRVGAHRVYEKPWHRAAAYHFASGMNVKQVAEANGMHPNTVTALLRTPWFQRHVTELMNAAGVDGVMALLKAEGLNSVATLIELRDNTDTPASVRADTAKEILNRVYGKPIQRVEADSTVRSADPVAEANALEAESRRIASDLGLNNEAES